jgi:VWFA-related protein
VLENMSGSDQSAIVHIGADAISQDFTSNKRLLLDSIDRFVGQKLRSAVLNKFDDVTLKAGADGALGEPRDFEAVERAAMARQSLQAVTNLTNYMAGIRGRRKALVLLSEGLTANMYDTIGPGLLGHDVYRDNDSTEAQYAAELALDMQNMVETATRANVVIYTVDPRGLTSEADESILLTGGTGSGGLAGGSGDAGDVGADVAAGSSPEGVLRGLREELIRSHAQLRTVAEQTGGIATVNTNSFDTGFDRIVKDNSTYYLLGYNVDPKYDGKFHNITVRVKRPGVEVRARKGYYALKTDPAASGAAAPDVLHDLLASPMPMAGLTMRVVSDAFKGTAGKALVQMAVEISGEDLVLAERDGRFTNTVELSYIAFDPSGSATTRGSKTLDLSLQPQNRDALSEHGLRFATELTLAPGRYQVRLAAKEAIGGRSGSVFWDIDVPRFDAPLSMSGVVLSSERVGAAPTVNDAATLKTMFPGVTTASRSFSLEDTVGVFAEIYDGAATPHDIDLSVAVLADDGFEMFKETATRPSTDLSAERGSLAYVTRIPLEDLAPGVFILRVEARSSLGGDPVVRDVRFEIK